MKRQRRLLAAVMAIGMMLALCACGEVDSSPVTDDEITSLYTSPGDFKGRTYEFTGQVLDVEKDGSDLYLQVYHDIKNYEENTIVVYPDADVDLKSDDYVKVSGTIDGEFSGENVLGTEVTAPQITATSVEKITAVEAFPAIKTVEVDKTIEKGKYKATASKVDFTKDETRIYLKVENNSKSDFDNYPDQGVIVQNGKQYEQDWNGYYPEPSTELKPGASSESVISFKKIDESDFTYSFQGNDSDYNEVDFTFKIKVK